MIILVKKQQTCGITVSRAVWRFKPICCDRDKTMPSVMYGEELLIYLTLTRTYKLVCIPHTIVTRNQEKKNHNLKFMWFFLLVKNSYCHSLLSIACKPKHKILNVLRKHALPRSKTMHALSRCKNMRYCQPSAGNNSLVGCYRNISFLVYFT